MPYCPMPIRWLEIPERGVWPVLEVFSPDEEIPETNETQRFLVTSDGTAYRVPLDAEPVRC